MPEADKIDLNCDFKISQNCKDVITNKTSGLGLLPADEQTIKEVAMRKNNNTVMNNEIFQHLQLQFKKDK